MRVAVVVAETETERPVIKGPYGRQYRMSFRGKQYGPFGSWDAAHAAAVQLLAKEVRRG